MSLFPQLTLRGGMQYIAVLRRCKMHERLRSARRAMHTRFPFSEALWLEWLEDELAGSRHAADQARIEALFDLAVQDYLSIPIWLRYLGCAFLQSHLAYAM